MKGMIKKMIVPMLYGLAGVLQTALAFAEEAGQGEEPITFMGDWLPRIVNFVIIAVIVVYFLRKPVRDMFANRTAEIAKAIQDAKEARERAVAALTDMEKKLKDFEAETGKLVAEAAARGEKDRQALVEEGKKMAQDVQVQVRQGIDIEVQKAKATLAAEASNLSLDLAEGRIKEKINDQDHERIVKEYIAKVGGRG